MDFFLLWKALSFFCNLLSLLSYYGSLKTCIVLCISEHFEININLAISVLCISSKIYQCTVYGEQKKKLPSII
jgi:hypothetical protein